MTVDARIWLHKLQVISLGRDNPSRNVSFHFIIVLPNINKLMILADANITIEYFVEGLYHMVLASSF